MNSEDRIHKIMGWLIVYAMAGACIALTVCIVGLIGSLLK